MRRMKSNALNERNKRKEKILLLNVPEILANIITGKKRTGNSPRLWTTPIR